MEACLSNMLKTFLVQVLCFLYGRHASPATPALPNKGNSQAPLAIRYAFWRIPASVSTTPTLFSNASIFRFCRSVISFLVTSASGSNVRATCLFVLD